ncbi:DUF998 domain-containing protein [Microbacterium jejuense]|uniref:DUF998 domain-containing protein n=1 Tax=Microbacterium jejuense TaxID=1263637 RepID=A0ABS7HPJ1_9MICO|nr:DUF998 domain-containing protein [Microbacterium jejuense]MBW9094882.1 DUF998 domain-containing protein [Microbacterium jejuense]
MTQTPIEKVDAGGPAASAQTAAQPRTPGETRRAAAATRLLDSSTERGLESLALGVGAIAFVVAALVALIVFRLQSAPIAGPGSIGQYAAIASGVAALLAVVAGRFVLRQGGRRSAPLRFLDYVDIAALAFAHAVIAVLGWTLLAVILEQSFLGAEVFALPVLVLAGAAAALSAYIAFYSATHMDLQLLAVVLAVFLVLGVVASMMTASDADWWKDNLSALGMSSNASSWAFNITIIVAGVLVTTLARYATRGVPTADERGMRWVRTLLVVVGVFLACVGIFHVDDFFLVHNTVATGMVVAYAALVIMLPRWIPGMPRAFFAVGWVFLAVTVVLGIFFAVGYYTLTAVELVAGILIFSWIVLFIRNAAALEQDAREA